jgi:type IX secretion system PorP/SprF family membrane protein
MFISLVKINIRRQERMKRILSIVATVATVFTLSAQQDPLNTLFVQNPSLANPAYAGAKEVMSVNLGTRVQWTGIDGAPRTSNLNFSTPLQGNSISLGFNVLSDKIGPTNQTGLFADIAYKLPIDNRSSLRVGIRAGVSLFTANLTELELSQGTGSTDVAFAQDFNGEILPNIGMGVYYENEKIFAGISVPSLIGFEIEGDDANGTRSFGKKQHIFGMVGGRFEMNSDLTLRPALTARFLPSAPVSVDVQVIADLYEKFGIGAMYRHKDAVAAILQFSLSEQLKLGYSYDFGISDYGNYNNGSHEIMLGFDFIYRKGRVNSPRYF